MTIAKKEIHVKITELEDRDERRLALVRNMKDIFNQRGDKALESARIEIYQKFPNNDDVSRAIRYFAKVTLQDVLPVFPALVSISFEAVGGEKEKLSGIGGAILFIAGAADVHDDVFDQSLVKGARRTVFGKFGKEIAILVGDVLLVSGLSWLRKECDTISREQSKNILSFVEQAIFDISRAEAQEVRMRITKDFSAEAYMDVIDLKAVVPELNMRIGATLGKGSAASVEALGHFGKIFGIVSTVAEEFMDLIENAELENRLKNNNPPLPLLYALRDPSIRSQILSACTQSLAKKSLEEIKRAVLSSPETTKLKDYMSALVQTEIEEFTSVISNNKICNELKTVLTSSLELLKAIDR